MVSDPIFIGMVDVGCFDSCESASRSAVTAISFRIDQASLPPSFPVLEEAAALIGVDSPAGEDDFPVLTMLEWR